MHKTNDLDELQYKDTTIRGSTDIQSKSFKTGDRVRTFETALIPGVGTIVGLADDDYDDCEDFYIVDFGEEGTCTVHKDDMERL